MNTGRLMQTSEMVIGRTSGDLGCRCRDVEVGFAMAIEIWHGIEAIAIGSGRRSSAGSPAGFGLAGLGRLDDDRRVVGELRLAGGDDPGLLGQGGRAARPSRGLPCRSRRRSAWALSSSPTTNSLVTPANRTIASSGTMIGPGVPVGDDLGLGEPAGPELALVVGHGGLDLEGPAGRVDHRVDPAHLAGEGLAGVRRRPRPGPPGPA